MQSHKVLPLCLGLVLETLTLHRVCCAVLCRALCGVQECIGSWLKRNCTCPLCKNNVLEAFKVQQYEARQARRNQRRGLTAPAITAAAGAPSDGSSSPTNSSSSSSSRAAEAAASDIQQQQYVEMTSLHPVGAPAAASPVPGWEGSRSESPWLPVDGGLRAPSPAAVALPGHADGSGEGVVALTVLPARTPAGRLPPLQHHQQQQQPGSNGSWLRSLAPAAAAGAPALVIPPSPSPSMLSLSLQSGSVLATPEDFAPAAAAAAAHLAETASRSRSMSPSSGLADAAQASVAALRSSSRTLGRRLHVLLSPSSAAPPAVAGASPDASSSQAASGSIGRGNSPLPPLLPVPGSFVVASGVSRVAVSIYACDPSLLQQQGAGSSGEHQAIAMPNLPGSVDGSGQGERPHQQHREQQH